MNRILKLGLKTVTKKQSWFYAINTEEMKRKITMMNKTRTAPKTQIVSLTSDEMNKLSTILHYETSISYLQKSDFDKSIKYTQFALNEAKSKYPESVTLHMCLMNRLSILQRLLGQKDQMLQNFEEIFLFCLSLKGEKSLETTKNLNNYLIALITEDLPKTKIVIQFLQESGFKTLIKSSANLIGIIKSLNGDIEQGIKMLKTCIDNSLGNKYANYNNIGWIQLVTSSKGVLEPMTIRNQQKIDQILHNLMKALGQSEKIAEKTQEQSIQLQQNQILCSEINKYLQNKNKATKLREIKPQTKLYGINSHIITMNIAFAFFMKKQFELSIIFMKIGIQAGIQTCEIQRLGLGLVLLSKVYFLSKAGWENIIKDILQDHKMYSRGVTGYCLLTYSKILMAQKRFYEGENIFHQSQKIKSGIETEGLILPDFDFSF